MAKCDCGREMLDGGTIGNEGCAFTHLVDMNENRVKRDTGSLGDVKSRCHDCGAKPDVAHHVNCDMEICPRCHKQLIGCDCEWMAYDDG